MMWLRNKVEETSSLEGQDEKEEDQVDPYMCQRFFVLSRKYGVCDDGGKPVFYTRTGDLTPRTEWTQIKKKDLPSYISKHWKDAAETFERRVAMCMSRNYTREKLLEFPELGGVDIPSSWTKLNICSELIGRSELVPHTSTLYPISDTATQKILYEESFVIRKGTGLFRGSGKICNSSGNLRPQTTWFAIDEATARLYAVARRDGAEEESDDLFPTKSNGICWHVSAYQATRPVYLVNMVQSMGILREIMSNVEVSPSEDPQTIAYEFDDDGIVTYGMLLEKSFPSDGTRWSHTEVDKIMAKFIKHVFPRMHGWYIPSMLTSDGKTLDEEIMVFDPTEYFDHMHTNTWSHNQLMKFKTFQERRYAIQQFREMGVV